MAQEYEYVYCSVRVWWEVKMGIKITGVIVVNPNNEYLIVQEENSGLWKPPSETVENGETPLEAILRGVKEETGLLINDVKLINEYQRKGFLGDKLQCYDFCAKLSGGELKPLAGEIKDIKWVNQCDLWSIAEQCHDNHHYGNQIKNYFKHLEGKLK